MVSIAQWLSSRVVLKRTDRLDIDLKPIENKPFDITDINNQLISIDKNGIENMNNTNSSMNNGKNSNNSRTYYVLF